MILRARSLSSTITTTFPFKYNHGNPVRIKHIGKAINDVQYNKASAYVSHRMPDGKMSPSTRAIIIAITRAPGSNTVKVVEAIKDSMKTMRQMIPASVDIIPIFNMADFIEESIWDVQFTLLLTIVLVILVIFVFLRELMPTFIPSVTIPLCMVATFAAMHMMGFSLNTLSLMALVLAVGFVVDDAIVMLENIVRHMENGEDALTATFNGSKEIGFTIISMTLSLVVVFVPLLFSVP